MRIRNDAKALYEALSNRKDVAPPEKPETRKGSIPWLIVQWGGSRLLSAVEGDLATMDVAIDPGKPGALGGRDDWQTCSPSSRASFIRAMRHVWGLSVTNKHPHVSVIGPKHCRDFLDGFKDTPAQRKNVRAMLRKLFSIALEEQEIERTPLAVVKASKRKRVAKAVTLWTREIVDGYARAALGHHWRAGRGGKAIPWRGGATMIRAMWETSADSYDVTSWTKANHFKDGAKPGILFDRGKTGVPAFVPISKKLAAEIRTNGSAYVVTDPVGGHYEGFKDDARLRGHLDTLRKFAKDAGLPSMVFDHLRHSAATDAEEHGATPDDVRHLTQHKNARTTKKHYLQISAKKAEDIQRARGLID